MSWLNEKRFDQLIQCESRTTTSMPQATIHIRLSGGRELKKNKLQRSIEDAIAAFKTLAAFRELLRVNLGSDARILWKLHMRIKIIFYEIKEVFFDANVDKRFRLKEVTQKF